jgi:hypothetical protein
VSDLRKTSGLAEFTPRVEAVPLTTVDPAPLAPAGGLTPPPAPAELPLAPILLEPVIPPPPPAAPQMPTAPHPDASVPVAPIANQVPPPPPLQPLQPVGAPPAPAPLVPIHAAAPVPAPEPISAGAPPVAAGPPPGTQRDRIVVLGRRAAGKTVYLATLYARLWKSLDGLTMKASSGVAHETSMRIVDNLTKGQWPAATLDTTTMTVDVRYHSRTRQMISMDYSGEVFRRAFVEDVEGTREVKELLDHLDSAGSIMLLLDPSVSGGDRDEIDAAVDDDFGMVQAVQRVRNWPGGDKIPIVLVLTKMDQNLPLIKKAGSASDFVRTYWPALTRTLGRLVIFQVSAVQVTRNAEGDIVPRIDSDPVNLENPLKYCLQAMDARDQKREQYERVAAQQERGRVEQEARTKEDKERSLLWLSVVVGMLLVGLFVVAAIMVFS